MTRCLPASGDFNSESRTSGWKLAHRSWLRMTLLVFFTGAFLAAVTVAVAREPDPQAAYGPPPQPPESAIVPDLSPVRATISGTAMGPSTVSSSWTMGPLPEGEGGVAVSATTMSPVTSTSMVTAAPR